MAYKPMKPIHWLVLASVLMLTLSCIGQVAPSPDATSNDSPVVVVLPPLEPNVTYVIPSVAEDFVLPTPEPTPTSTPMPRFTNPVLIDKEYLREISTESLINPLRVQKTWQESDTPILVTGIIAEFTASQHAATIRVGENLDDWFPFESDNDLARVEFNCTFNAAEHPSLLDYSVGDEIKMVGLFESLLTWASGGVHGMRLHSCQVAE